MLILAGRAVQQVSSRDSQGRADAIGLAAPGDEAQSRYADDAAVLTAARAIGETVLGPAAQETDQMPGPNLRNFDVLAAAGLFGVAVSRAYGGLDVGGATQRELTEVLASYCGVTTFTQAQHHGPCRMIAGGPNEALRNRLLPDLALGSSLSGVSFAHLRRPGPPSLRAEPVHSGFVLHGKAPWVTGWGLIDQLVFGATLPDGRFVYLWSPVDRSRFADLFPDLEACRDAWGSLTASPPIPLCAMGASATAEVICDAWFVPEEHRLWESDRETMRQNDRNGVLGPTAMPLGCAAGSVRVLRETAERRRMPAVERSAGRFAEELGRARAEVTEWSERFSDGGFFEQGVRIRAWCIALAVRAAHAAVTASSGAANTLAHPAQRLYREAMFYSVQAQTPEVMDATLALLENSAPGDTT